MEIPSFSFAADWAQWRGPSRSGLIQADRDWPEKLSGNSLQSQWSVELGPSYSTPIVKGDRVFTTETVDKAEEVVRAFSLKTGEQLWSAKWKGAMTVPFFAAANGSWIRATPIADDKHIYVAGMRDVLVCLEQATGNIKWKADFAKQLGTELPSFGYVSSPLIVGDSLYTQAGGGFVKIDKNTGKVQWRVLDDGGGMSGSAFSSPVLETIDGIPQLIVQTRTELTGVDPESGNVLWKQAIEAFRGMNILTPIRFQDSIFTSAYGGGSVLILASQEQTDWKAEQVWRNKLQAYMSTPLLIDGHVYMHLRNKRFACLNLTTGEEAWVTKPFGDYWSMVSNGEMILALDSDGDLRLIEASPQEFRLVDEVHVSDSPTWAHVVLAGDLVLVRSLDKLNVYRWQ